MVYACICDLDFYDNAEWLDMHKVRVYFFCQINIPVEATLDISRSPIRIQWGSRKISKTTFAGDSIYRPGMLRVLVSVHCCHCKLNIQQIIAVIHNIYKTHIWQGRKYCAHGSWPVGWRNTLLYAKRLYVGENFRLVIFMVTTVAPNFALWIYINIQMYVNNTYSMFYYLTCSSVRNDFLVLVWNFLWFWYLWGCLEGHSRGLLPCSELCFVPCLVIHFSWLDHHCCVNCNRVGHCDVWSNFWRDQWENPSRSYKQNGEEMICIYLSLWECPDLCVVCRYCVCSWILQISY